MAYNQIIEHGIADYQSWVEIPSAIASGITEGTSTNPAIKKYAKLVHVIGGSMTLSGGTVTLDPQGQDTSDNSISVVPANNIPMDTYMGKVKLAGWTSTGTITRPNTTPGYTAGDAVGAASDVTFSFSNVVGATYAGAYITVKGIEFMQFVASVASGITSFRLHLFDTQPTALADDAVWVLADADRTKYLGFIDIPTPYDLGNTCYAQDGFIEKPIKLAGGSTTLYGQLQTAGGYTASANAVYVIRLVGRIGT